MVKKEKLICSHCIEEFDVTNIFIAQVPNREYSTVYCEKCLKELGIKEFNPYKKPRKPRPTKPKSTTNTKRKSKTTAKPASKRKSKTTK